jgi:23S rRNA (guanosine2251-2'-O)-methyltransferase
VLEALRGPREVYEIYIAAGTEPSKQVDEITSLAGRAGVSVKEVPRARIETLARTGAPQGVVARVEPFHYSDFGNLLARLGSIALPLVLALDGVEDPQNFGALLRVADAAGVDAVLVPGKRSVAVTTAVAKASAGAAEHVDVVRSPGLPSALERLKEAGLWVVGAEAEGAVPYHDVDMNVPLALVLGGEGKGLGRLVKERCDVLVSLPMRGKVGSLNVATAGAVLLYEALRQRA